MEKATVEKRDGVKEAEVRKGTRSLFYREAIVEAQRDELRRDASVFILGEDVGIYGGVFKVTRGLMDEFGFWRVLDTPISESLIVGAATGAALVGMRPIAEIQFADFIHGAHDQLTNQAGKIYYRTGGTWPVPMVVRVVYGGDVQGGMYHSQSPESWYMHSPGLKVVAPSTPYDAVGLLKSAVRDNNPVLYFEHKKLYNTIKGDVPYEDYTIPIGVAEVKRPGKDLSFIAYGLMLHRCLRVADMLAKEGVDAEVLDLRTLSPLDRDAIIATAKKTGKVVVVHEATLTCGAGAEIAATVQESCWDHLDAPVKRIAAPDGILPFHPAMEAAFIPSIDRIYKESLEFAKS